MTDSREGLFLIRLVGLKSSLQPDNLSGGSEECRVETGREACENLKTGLKAGNKMWQGRMDSKWNKTCGKMQKVASDFKSDLSLALCSHSSTLHHRLDRHRNYWHTVLSTNCQSSCVPLVNNSFSYFHGTNRGPTEIQTLFFPASPGQWKKWHGTQKWMKLNITTHFIVSQRKMGHLEGKSHHSFRLRIF